MAKSQCMGAKLGCHKPCMPDMDPPSVQDGPCAWVWVDKAAGSLSIRGLMDSAWKDWWLEILLTQLSHLEQQ